MSDTQDVKISVEDDELIVVDLPSMNGLVFRQALSPQEVWDGRRIQAKAYASQGYQEALDLTTEVIEDEWVKSSTYFVAVLNNEIVGSARTIHSQAPTALPALSTLQVDPYWEQKLGNLKGNEIVEISALAGSRIPEASFGSIIGGIFIAMHEAAMKTNDQRWWVSIVDTRLHRILSRSFQLNMIPMGPKQDYYGGSVVPCVMNLGATWAEIEQAAPTVKTWYEESIDLDVPLPANPS